MTLAASKFQAPKGTRDVLSPESARQRALVNTFAVMAERAGFGQIVSPMFEEVGVFKRLGEATDVVSKEMFTFFDKDQKSPTEFALRPELTASVVRAFVQHRPLVPWKAWYEGPQFRYEKPQAGRYRQFNQIGVEALGTDDPHMDVEVIALAADFYAELGLTRNRLLINSLGDASCRPAYLEALTTYFQSNLSALSEQSRVTLEINPLRVLDSKREQDQQLIDDAPVMVDFLSEDTGSHFASVRAGLELLGIPYEISPRLVRGLDYYTRTTFEFANDVMEAAQNAVGGGGRYDGLAQDLGGPATPGVGFALGVERILLACDAEGVFPAPGTTVDVFVVDATGGENALALAAQMRSHSVSVDRAFDGRSMKSQMKAADRSGAAVALILGEDEMTSNTVTIRSMRTNDPQVTVPRAQVAEEVLKRLEQQQ